MELESSYKRFSDTVKRFTARPTMTGQDKGIRPPPDQWPAYRDGSHPVEEGRQDSSQNNRDKTSQGVPKRLDQLVRLLTRLLRKGSDGHMPPPKALLPRGRGNRRGPRHQTSDSSASEDDALMRAGVREDPAKQPREVCGSQADEHSEPLCRDGGRQGGESLRASTHQGIRPTNRPRSPAGRGGGYTSTGEGLPLLPHSRPATYPA